jgi:hypothetical protein
VIHLNGSFDEVHVYDGVAERTGTRVDRAAIRGRSGVCRSLRALGTHARRLGDGYYYLASDAWPADTDSVTLTRVWTGMS